MEDLFIVVDNANETKTLQLRALWKNGIYHIFVTDSVKCWTAEVANELIQNLASQHKMDVEDYNKQVQECLFGKKPNLSGIQSSFDIIEKQFIIFRNYSKFFVVDMEESDYDPLLLIDNLITFCDNKKNQCEELTVQQQELDKETDDWKQKILETRTEMDRSKYQNICAFLKLVEQKQVRIRFLFELLKSSKNYNQIEFETDSSTDSSNVDDFDCDISNLEEEIIIVDDDPMEGPSTLNRDFDFLGENSPPRTVPMRLTNNPTEPVLIISENEFGERLQERGTESDDVEFIEQDRKVNTQQLLDEI